MVALLLAYVVLHTGLRSVIADLLGTTPQGCYLCAGGVAPAGATAAVSVAALIVGSVVAGFVIVDTGGWRSYEVPVAFGLTAFALLTVPAAIVAGIGSAIGEPLLRPPAGPLLALVPSAVIVVASVNRGWRPRPLHLSAVPAQPLPQLVLGLGALLLFGAVLVSLTHPPTQGDALSYHTPLSVFLWHDGNLTSFLDRAPENWALAHPGSTELWLGSLRFLGGEQLADLGQLPFALLAAAGVAAFSRRLGGDPGAAWLAAGAVLLAPIVIGQVGTQANDLSTGALAVAVSALVVAPPPEWTPRRATLVGVGIGLIFASKLALLPDAIVVAAFAVAAIRHIRATHQWRLLAFAGAAFLVVVSPWWIRDLIRFQNPLYPARIPIYGHGINDAALGAIDSQFVPSRISWPLYPLAEPHDDRSGFGALLAVAALPGFIVLASRSRRGSPRRRPLALLIALVLVGLPSWWLFTAHEPRFLLLDSALALACTPFVLLAVPRRSRRVATWLLAVTACFSAAVTVDQVLLPYARQPSARAAYYDRVWGVDPYVSSLPTSVGLLWDTGYGPAVSDYTAYYPLLGTAQRRLVVPIDVEPTSRATTAATARRLIARMRHMKVRYAYVQAVPGLRSLVNILYPTKDFQLVHVSAIAVDGRLGGRRHLYRDVPPSSPGAIWRYLFRLRE